MVKSILYSNPDVTTTTTTTAEALSYGETEITVADSTDFSANDFVLFEAQGNEYNEILKISSIDSDTQITLTSGIQYPHISGIIVTKLNYDKYRIYTSTTGATSPDSYTLLTTGDLDYANKFNRIEYDDVDGRDSYYYQIYYYNSQTTTEDLQTTLNDQDNFSWMTITNFQNQSGMDSTYSNFSEDALKFGVESIKDDLFFNKLLETTERDVEFNLDIGNYFIADYNADREISSDDLIVYEYNPNTELRTYLHHKIVKVFDENPKIVFNSTVPTSGSTLIVQIPVAQVAYADYKQSYSEINKLYAINYLLGNKTTDAVKNAILNWTAGGTSVTREPNAISEAIRINNERIQDLMKDLLLKTYIGKTRLRTTASSLNVRSRGISNARNSFTTVSGNSYRY